MKNLKAIFYSALIFFLLSNNLNLHAQNVKIKNGLITVRFETQYGTVKIFMPENYVPWQRISGTYKIEPKGYEKSRDKNFNKLLEYSVQIGLKKFKLKDLKYLITPQSDYLSLSLIDDNNKIIQSHEVVLSTKYQPSVLSYPAAMQYQAIYDAYDAHSQIYGNFSGDIDDLNVIFDAKPNTTGIFSGDWGFVIAASPIQIIFNPPKLKTGLHNLQIIEKGVKIGKKKIPFVGVNLSIGKPHLKKGENTNLLARSFGLNLLKGPTPFIVKNLTPGIVTLQGGNFQTIMIPRQDKDYVKSWSINSIKTGSFTISGELILPDTKYPDKDLENNWLMKKAEEEKEKNIVNLIISWNKDTRQIFYDCLLKAKEAEKKAIPPHIGASISKSKFYYNLNEKILKSLKQKAHDEWKAERDSGRLNEEEQEKAGKKLMDFKDKFSGTKAHKKLNKEREKKYEKLKRDAKKARKKANILYVHYINGKAVVKGLQKVYTKKQAETKKALVLLNNKPGEGE